MLADGAELGEWGFSALVEADGHRILFDTGGHSDVVLKNCGTLKIDLTTVPEVVLSHWHPDHVGGFITLRDSVPATTPTALARTHVGEGIFLPRTGSANGVEINPMLSIKPNVQEKRWRVCCSRQARAALPWGLADRSGARKYPERNWSKGVQVKAPTGMKEDNLPEDTALIFDTDKGLVVLTGCGHAGVVNIADFARATVRPARIYALIGGLHLFEASEKTLVWTAEKLNSFRVDNLLGAHCTGVETVYRFRHDLGLDRSHAVVGAVGATFELGHGIDPRQIAK